jgi:squalene cyclase
MALSMSGPVSAQKADPARVVQDNVVVDEGTARIIDGGLKFLASRQRDDGSWSVGGDDHAAAVTAYVIHAFMASGHVPGEGPYRKTIDKAIDFLLGCVRDDGYIASQRGQHNMYGHGIATAVLGEVYGQTQDARVRAALEKAVKCIINAQNDEGGWRYQPRPADADISVTVLQLVALRVARNSGIAVPQQVFDDAVKYVRLCYVEREGGFSYQARGGGAGFARTAAAVYSLQVCGLYDDPLVKQGVKFLNERFERDTEWFTYGNFYAAPANYMQGGDTWTRWYKRIHAKLTDSVKKADDLSYWEPLDGRGQNEIYATSVYVSILSIPYGYLPIYQR